MGKILVTLILLAVAIPVAGAVLGLMGLKKEGTPYTAPLIALLWILIVFLIWLY